MEFHSEQLDATARRLSEKEHCPRRQTLRQGPATNYLRSRQSSTKSVLVQAKSAWLLAWFNGSRSFRIYVADVRRGNNTDIIILSHHIEDGR